MDDPTVNWSRDRFNEIESKMIHFLKASGYDVKKDVMFLPMSGLVGENMKSRVDKSTCSWWEGPCLFEALDSIEFPLRDPKGPFRMPIIEKFEDMGTIVMGKVESGSVIEGDSLLVMPNETQVNVVAIYSDGNKVRYAGPGENLYIQLSGIDHQDISYGFILSSIERPIHAVTEFVAQLQILELPDNEIITAGYEAVLHIHAVVEQCLIVDIVSRLDPNTMEPMGKKPLCVMEGAVVDCLVQGKQLLWER